MRYLILIYENEASVPQDEGELQKWFEYTERLKAFGCYLGGEALQPTATATTVRVNGGRTLTTDGPFAETKEQLGGFYMVDCKNLDEAPRVDRGRDRTTRSRGHLTEGEVAPAASF